MTRAGWWLVESTARLLKGDQREAVLGDLVEAGQSTWTSLKDILDLALRMQAALWKDWRPWFAGFGVSLPASFLLMGLSLSVSLSVQQCLTPQISGGSIAGIQPLLSRALLLIGEAFGAGYVVALVSRRTLWVSAFLCCCPCLFCLERFRVPSLSRFCLLLFLLPAILGVWQGLRSTWLRCLVETPADRNTGG
jgi:hypothetical protein